MLGRCTDHPDTNCCGPKLGWVRISRAPVLPPKSPTSPIQSPAGLLLNARAATLTLNGTSAPTKEPIHTQRTNGPVQVTTLCDLLQHTIATIHAIVRHHLYVTPATSQMEGPATAGSSLTGLPAAVARWEQLITRARLQRLDPDQFGVFSKILLVKHPLPPGLIAELLLRPTADNNVALDPRTPLYLTHLIKQRRVDTASVLNALYKYSTIHTKIHPQPEDQPSKERDASAPRRKKLQRWTSSYSSEAILFWRLAQTVNQGIGIKSGRDVVETSRMLVRWMALFTEAATIFSQDAFGSMHSLNASKLEMERSRESFIMFLNAFSAHPTVPKTFQIPAAKGTPVPPFWWRQMSPC